MKSVVVIPTCKRPELLALCLLRLSGAPGCPEVHIYADTAANLNDVSYVRDEYFPTASIFHARPHPAVFSGCWNILNSIASGARFADDVYLVEEDVMVYSNFFSWHESTKEAVSCGRTTGKCGYYTNPGSLLRRPLLDALLPHINDQYFADTEGYCARNFAHHYTSSLDDGLIRRVIAQKGLDWHNPVTAVCAHQGFYFYDKLDIYKNYGGDVEEKIGRFLEIEEQIKTKPDWRYKHYAQDFEPFSPGGAARSLACSYLAPSEKPL